jgi:hypothetical protein
MCSHVIPERGFAFHCHILSCQVHRLEAIHATPRAVHPKRFCLPGVCQLFFRLSVVLSFSDCPVSAASLLQPRPVNGDQLQQVSANS